MKKYSAIFLFIFILVNLCFCSYSILHGELNFFNDVARDFLLLQELDTKKFMLIGPRSNTSGLFHGPLWSYINYPAYLLGNGNPVVIARFWILLAISSLLAGFWAAKKLFGTLPAFGYAVLFSANLIPRLNGLIHADAPVFLMPLFFYTIALYLRSEKIRYGALHLLIICAIIQFNVGLGIPLLMLSGLVISIFMVKNKLWSHLVLLPLIPFFLSNFIIFDLRHRFMMLKSALAFMQVQQSWSPMPYHQWLLNRLLETVNLRLTLNYAPIVPALYHTLHYNLIFLSAVFGLVIIFTFLQMKKSQKYRRLYLLFLFYYFGYMLLTLTNKGVILNHFVFFLMSLTSLWFASFLAGKYRRFFMALLIIISLVNLQQALVYLKYLRRSFFDKHPESWRALSNVAEAVILRQKKEPFGYFVFSPDAFAYQPRYAMLYHFKAGEVEAYEYQKKPVTYIIAAPPPAEDPYMNHVWWRKNPLRITPEPIWSKTFPGGYTLEEYRLNPEEQNIPHDKTIELKLHFR